MTFLNANADDEKNAVLGQGTGIGVNITRKLKLAKAATPDQTSFHEKPYLYQAIISPENVQYDRVVQQVSVSANPRVPISSQLNNKLDPTLDYSGVGGGKRQSI
jgi:hypothetical protein